MEVISEKQVFRTKVSQGYQVAVPAQLRKRYGIEVSDEIVWIFDDGKVRAGADCRADGLVVVMC